MVVVALRQLTFSGVQEFFEEKNFATGSMAESYANVVDELQKIHVEIETDHLMILNKKTKEVYELKFKKEEFIKKWEEYILKTNTDILTLKLWRVCQNLEVSNIFSDNENGFILLQRNKYKHLESMTTSEIGSYLSIIDFADVAKVVINQKLVGPQLAEFTQFDYENYFGIVENTGRAAILFEIFRKMKEGMAEKDQLFIYGKNPKNFFNCGYNLSKPFEINLPNLDYGEKIENVVIGAKNVVFSTSLNRNFMVVNRLKSDRVKIENGFMWHADFSSSKKKEMLCSQRYSLNYELKEKNNNQNYRKKSLAGNFDDDQYDNVQIRKTKGRANSFFENVTDSIEVSEEIFNPITSNLDLLNEENFEMPVSRKKSEIGFDFRGKQGNFYNKKRKEKQEKGKKKRHQKQQEKQFELKEDHVKFRGKKSKRKKSEMRMEKKKMYEWRIIGSLMNSLYGFSNEKNISPSYKQMMSSRIQKILPLKSKFVVICKGEYNKNITEVTRKCNDESLLVKYIIENKRINYGNLHIYLRDQTGLLEKVKLPKYLTYDHNIYDIECIKVKGKEPSVWIDRHEVFDESSFL